MLHQPRNFKKNEKGPILDKNVKQLVSMKDKLQTYCNVVKPAFKIIDISDFRNLIKVAGYICGAHPHGVLLAITEPKHKQAFKTEPTNTFEINFFKECKIDSFLMLTVVAL